MKLERLAYFGENCSIHGVNYVVSKKMHIMERMAWFCIMCISFYGMMLIFLASYNAYDTNPMSFVTETTYLNWNTSFPAVSICQLMNQDIYYTSEPNGPYSLVQAFISEVVFFTGSCYSCKQECTGCHEVDMLEVVKKYRKHCSDLIGQCKWNNELFNCCDKFLPLDTEYGMCFTINSVHTKKLKNSEIWMDSNRVTGIGELSVEALDDVRIFFHAPEDVPFINADPDRRDDVMSGEKYVKQFYVIEIENDEEVQHLPVRKRGCRFPDEPPSNMWVHTLYSYSTCVVQCHADAHKQFCNCTHHLMPNSRKEDHCNIAGLKCLTENYEILNRLHSKGFDKPGLDCDCVPSCVEPEYKVTLKQSGVSGSKSEIIMRLQNLPSYRFKRNVVRSTLDLMNCAFYVHAILDWTQVSIGGTAGLFFGASLLSIIEMFYLFAAKRPVTMVNE